MTKPCARCKVEPRRGKDAYCGARRTIKAQEYLARLGAMDRSIIKTNRELLKLADGYRPR